MSKKTILTAALVMIGITAQATESRLCLQVISNMYNENTKEIKMANNSCVANELKTQGFKEVSMDFDATPADEDSSQLTLITNGKYKLANSVPVCANEAACRKSIVANSKLVLSLPLLGCLDTASVTYKVTRSAKGSVSVLVSALNVENKRSRTVRCFAAPIAEKSIELGGSVMNPSELKVEFIQNVAQ